MDDNAEAEEDAWAVLGLRRTCDARELTRAYRKKARECHPDRCSDPDAKERFQRLQSAYERVARTLGDDPRLRGLGEISLEDVVAYEDEYRGSAEERADVLDAAARCERFADVVHYVPYSTPGDLERFARIVATAGSAGGPRQLVN
jgi:hypothetical protein